MLAPLENREREMVLCLPRFWKRQGDALNIVLIGHARPNSGCVTISGP
jgi:hypothetical protein